jgi:hypothetical protein
MWVLAVMQPSLYFTQPTYMYALFGLMAIVGLGLAIYSWRRKAEWWRITALLVMTLAALLAIPSFRGQYVKLEGTVLEENAGLVFLHEHWQIDLAEVRQIDILSFEEKRKERELWEFHLASGERRSYKPSFLWLDNRNEILEKIPGRVKVNYSKAR